VNTAAGPLSYAFSFNTPLVANLLGPVESHAELGVTLTDGFNHGATVQPATPGGKMLTSFDLDVTGVPVSKNVDIGDLFSMLSGTSGTTFSKDGSPVCHQACATMSVLLAFPLIGEDSVASSGKVVQVVQAVRCRHPCSCSRPAWADLCSVALGVRWSARTNPISYVEQHCQPPVFDRQESPPPQEITCSTAIRSAGFLLTADPQSLFRASNSIKLDRDVIVSKQECYANVLHGCYQGAASIKYLKNA
jgi:hypothetical protein